jgi:hypothetical protein
MKNRKLNQLKGSRNNTFIDTNNFEDLEIKSEVFDLLEKNKM